jgi:hypothetical protein
MNCPTSRGAPTGQKHLNHSSTSLQPRRWAHIKRYMKKRLPKIAFGILLVGSVGYLASSVKEIIENSLMIHNFTTLRCNHIECSA